MVRIFVKFIQILIYYLFQICKNILRNMSGFPLLICFATVVVFGHLAFVESQDFCESYKKNNYSLIVFSQSNDTILLIVDKHFWRLKEEGRELVFKRTDFQASNSSEQWTQTNYTFAQPLYGNLIPKEFYFENFRGIILFKYHESIFDKKGLYYAFQRDYYFFYGNYFSDRQFYRDWFDSKINEWIDSKDDNRISFTIIERQLDFEVIQRFDHTLKKFVTERVALNVGKHSYYSYYITTNFTEKSIGTQIYTQIEKLRNFTNDIPFIGSYLNSKKEIIFFLRIKDDIKYCTIEKCYEKNYTVLISCQLTQLKDTSIDIRIPIAIICVVIVVFVIIVLIVIYCLRKSKGKKGVKIDWQNVTSINTINSETGLPLHLSEKPGTSGKRVSPPKPQNKTEASKPKVISKPKKSPKTKK